jgi:hypothetical protein
VPGAAAGFEDLLADQLRVLGPDRRHPDHPEQPRLLAGAGAVTRRAAPMGRAQQDEPNGQWL